MRYRITLLALALIWSACSRKSQNEIGHTQFIPENASVILQVRNLSNFKSELLNCDYLDQVNSDAVLSYLTGTAGLLNEVDADSTALLSLSQAAGKEALLMATFTASTRFPGDSTAIVRSDTITPAGISLTKYTRDTLVLYSTTEGPISLWSDKADLLLKISRNTDNRIPTELSRLMETSSARKSATLYRKTYGDRFIQFFPINKNGSRSDSLPATWQSMDLDLGQASVSGSGIVYQMDSSRTWASLFRNTSPLESNLPALAPLQADALLSFSFDDYSEYARNQEAYLNQELNLEPIFSAVETGGIIYLNKEKIVVLGMFDAEAFETFLDQQQTGSKEFQGSEIISLRDTDFLNTYFNPLISNFEAHFLARLENQFVFAENSQALEKLLQAYNSGSVYALNPVYESTAKFRSREASLQFIADAKGMDALIEEPIFRDSDIAQAVSFPKGYAYTGQLVSGSDFTLNNMAITRVNKKADLNTTSEVFRLQLDGEIATKPQFVINHRNRKKEIVVQDEENKLYLISREGKILWKKQLDSRIQGDIQQVDLYKNGRLQLAFTTNDQFLVLDRNGKEVEPFTMSFKGGNLNPLAVFDYENNRNYRFVVTQGRKIYMYNRKGQTVSGFTYTEAEAAVLREPQHFRVGSRDYLVFQLENGSLEILNRVGKTRVPVSQRFSFSDNRVYLYRNQFTFTDDTGRLYAIDTKGKLSASRLNLDALHRIDATSKTLATLTENILTIKGKPITLELGVYTAPKIFYLYDKIYVSVTDLQGERVYLFDSQSKGIPGFPVYGTAGISLDDLDNDRKLELVTKGKDKDLILYRMN
ncbi:MAG: ribonuclease HII [Eudoraea sp.]|nr:ribonuclease HII [Eudoraea sp.]NNJ40337.1 ribonuclease HII [Eudoraea sp.]